MTGMILVHCCNNKRNNSQKHPEKKRTVSSYLDLPNINGQCQTIILRKPLQIKMKFLKEAMLKGNQKSLTERGNNVFSTMDPVPSTELFFLINLFDK